MGVNQVIYKLIDYYKKEGVLVEVDGTQNLEKVFQDIVAVLGA